LDEELWQAFAASSGKQASWWNYSSFDIIILFGFMLI
jgi:hypothetical protein